MISIFFYFGYFAAIYGLTVALEIIILDYPNLTMLIFFKLSYIEFKRQGKKQSKKKIFRLMNQDLFDRWLCSYCYIYVFTKGIYENRINEANYIHFLNIATYILITEVIAKWFKDLVMLKVSGSGETAIVMNEITFEITSLHENMKYQYLKIHKNYTDSDLFNPLNTPDRQNSGASTIVARNKLKRNSSKVTYNDIIKIRKQLQPSSLIIPLSSNEETILLEDNYIKAILNYSWSNTCIDNFALVERYKQIINYDNLILIEMEIFDVVFLVNYILYYKQYGLFGIRLFYSVFPDFSVSRNFTENIIFSLSQCNLISLSYNILIIITIMFFSFLFSYSTKSLIAKYSRYYIGKFMCKKD